MSVTNPLTPQNQTLYIGGIPKEGPQSLLVNVDLTAGSSLDLTTLIGQGKLSGVQAIFVDLSNCDKAVSITAQDTNQTITCAPFTQGYYPILAGKYLKFNMSSDFNGQVPIFFLNFAVAAGVWKVQ